MNIRQKNKTKYSNQVKIEPNVHSPARFSPNFNLKTFVLDSTSYRCFSLCRLGFHLKRPNLNLMHVLIVVSLQVLRWWTGWCSCSWL